MPGKKRDEGAKRAKGEYLAFIDDDSAPRADWLQNANNILLKDKKLVALGGPGVLPKNATFWERVFDQSLLNTLGGGGYTYRFQPQKERYVDDYPSMNLIINKKIFLKIGGFNNEYWPGEDSKLGNILSEKEKKLIYYNPNLVVYHHRRDSIKGHLKQYQQYGTMRGMFFVQGDKNSIRFQYVVPSLLTMYLTLYILAFLLQLTKPYNTIIFFLISLPFLTYVTMLLNVGFTSFIQSKRPKESLAILYIVPLTHIVYGYFFILGTIKETLKTPSNSSIKNKI